MAEPAATRRRFKFSLRALFMAMTIACATVGWRLHVAQGHQALYAQLAEQHVSLKTMPDPEIPVSDATYYWDCFKALFGYETVYHAWIDCTVNYSRPGLKSNLQQLRAIHPRVAIWDDVGKCMSVIDLEDVHD